MRRRALIAASLTALGWASGLPLAFSDTAAADVFGPAELLSSRPVQTSSGPLAEQAEDAEQSVLSADGRYVAFVGSFGGVQGIWRRDLQSGTVEQVAPRGAEMPSISREGRYVSFTTATRLAPEDDRNKAPDVYRRDMEKPCQTEGEACLPCGEHQAAEERERCPFVLVSAVNGSSEGASYKYANTGASEEQLFGSLAAGRSAMSADGQHVAFETAAESNLLGAPTPPWEILVRNLESNETTLVSSEYDPRTNTNTGAPVPDQGQVGAAYPVLAFGGAEFGGASISADGSTVAWLGRDVARQAQMLPGEYATFLPERNEPLWRRIDRGPGSPTRRVTGGSEPENPLCVASGESQLGGGAPNPLDPCQGPFTTFNLNNAQNYLVDGSAGLNFVPQLSASGDTVAFLASAQEVAAGQAFSDAEGGDLYISDMTEGVTRVRALHRLTEISGEAADAERAAPITDLAISPGGNDVAFTTKRTQFPLGIASYVSPTAPRLGITELFDVSLQDGTLTRLTHGFAGEAVPSEQFGATPGNGAGSPSFSEDGNAVSFSSSASNLVYGDGNGASDAYLLSRVVFASQAPQQYISSPPAPPVLVPTWRLFATAASRPDGTVVLDVAVPGPGALSAGAGASVPIVAAHRAGAHARRGATGRSQLQLRTVASARAHVAPTTDGLERMILTLASPYRSLAQRAKGLDATVAVKFTAAGRAPLRASLNITFRRVSHARGKKAAHKAHARTGAGR